MPPFKTASTNKLAGSTIKGGKVSQWTDAQNNVGRQLMMYYLGAGWSKAGAAGMIGNQMQESGLDPAVVQSNGEGHYLSQWGGSRLSSLRSFASAQGLPVTSVEAQAKFTVSEVKSGYGSLDKLLQTATDPGKAAVAVSNIYERPAAWAANNAGRANYANQAYVGLTGASGIPADGSGQGSGASGGGGSPTSILDLITSPVDTIGGWLASIVVTLAKDAAIGIYDTIVLPFVHWQERSVMDYYTVMFGSQSWPMIPWNAAFWGLGYWLLFADTSGGTTSLKPGPVRNSRLGGHVRLLQSVPARKQLIKPKDVDSKTPRKPKPVQSTAVVHKSREMNVQRSQPVRVTGDTDGRRNDSGPPPEGRPRRAAQRNRPRSVTDQGNRARGDALPASSGIARGRTEKGSGERPKT